MKRKENAVRGTVAVLRAVMIPALLFGCQGTLMHVQAADAAQAETVMAEVPPETAPQETAQPESEGTAAVAQAAEPDTAQAQADMAAEESQAQAENAEAAGNQPETAEETVQPLSVTMVGDSVLLGASPAILAMQPDCVIDAKVSRQFVQAGAVLDSLEVQGRLRQTVVMELGTNGPFSAAKGQELIDRLGSGRTIYWVTVYGRELGWQEDSNATIRQLAAQNENVHIIDWSQAVSGHPEWLCGDGIHLSAAGRDAYANIVLGGLQ